MRDRRRGRMSEAPTASTSNGTSETLPTAALWTDKVSFDTDLRLRPGTESCNSTCASHACGWTHVCVNVHTSQSVPSPAVHTHREKQKQIISTLLSSNNAQLSRNIYTAHSLFIVSWNSADMTHEPCVTHT